MKQSIGLLALILAMVEAGQILLGGEALLVIASGAMTLMALMIAGTFLWLWAEMATPLALGMAYGWSGAGLLAGAWWLTQLGVRPAWSSGDLAMLLALPAVGAVLHFAVIHRSFGFHGGGFWWPVLAALGLSSLVYALT